MPAYFDAHAHVQFPAYDEDRAAVLRRAREAETWMVNVGTDLQTSRDAVALADHAHEGVFATVGIHPTHACGARMSPCEEGNVAPGVNEAYQMLAAHEKVVAIGECGLDYYRADETTRTEQEAVFVEQIELANMLEKPLMLHIRSGSSGRSAYRDAFEILKAHAQVLGNVHFFAGSWEEAQLFLDIGFTLSFTGVITFARDYDETIKNTPLDRLLSETDCPYVAPVPHRGKRNEPVYVSEVVKKIAEIKGVAHEEVAEQLVRNAQRFFKVG